MNYKIAKSACILKVKQPLEIILNAVLFNSGIDKESVVAVSQILYRQTIGRL